MMTTTPATSVTYNGTGHANTADYCVDYQSIWISDGSRQQIVSELNCMAGLLRTENKLSISNIDMINRIISSLLSKLD